MSQPEKIKFKGHVYVRADAQPAVIKIAGKEYVLAQMTSEDAAKAALDISRDIDSLALFLKNQGLGKDYENLRKISQLFSKTSDDLLDYKAK